MPQSNEPNTCSRRTFLTAAALAAASTATSPAASSPGASSPAPSSPAPSSPAWDILRPPDSLSIYLGNTPAPLQRSGPAWQSSGIEILTQPTPQSLSITVHAPTLPLTRVHLRWKLPVPGSLLFLGDAWERSYGELCWRTMVPERVMPWYFATHDGQAGQGTHAYGVQTAAAALCFWQVDPQGVSLWLDLSNGGSPVLLGQRQLAAATLVSHSGAPGQHPIESVAALCRKMSPHPRLPSGPIYGTNDWYYAYGRNTAANILRDTDLVVQLAPSTGPRPFSVIDGGWEGDGATARGQSPNPSFPDMPGLAAEIRKRGARPGIWIRPLEAAPGADPALLLPAARFASVSGDNDSTHDPTIPEALHAALARLQRLVDWKYDLIKHDFSTYDLLGQWGFTMGAQPARPGWSFHDRTRTTAEIIRSFYQAIRDTAGDHTLVEGCNTIGHLGAGLFEMQRIGDDTSGRQWERTRRMGVNTLAYRLPQHQTFFAVDADCVPITRSLPWELSRQWLDLVARSGTSLFISPAPDATGPEQKAALAAAFALAAGSGSPDARAQDWLTSTTPEAWEFRHPNQPAVHQNYDWCDPSGADPYPA